MAATYYAQLLARYRWADIADALWAVVRIVQEWYDETDGNLASSPTDGWDIKTKGILANATYEDDEQEIVATVYLGQLFRESPSGSFYAPWSAVPETVRDKDARWWEALGRCAARFGLSIENGEGDPTDVYATLYAPASDNLLAAALMPNDIGAK